MTCWRVRKDKVTGWGREKEKIRWRNCLKKEDDGWKEETAGARDWAKKTREKFKTNITSKEWGCSNYQNLR